MNEDELMNVDGGFFISGATLGTIAACCAIVTFCYGAGRAAAKFIKSL